MGEPSPEPVPAHEVLTSRTSKSRSPAAATLPRSARFEREPQEVEAGPSTYALPAVQTQPLPAAVEPPPAHLNPATRRPASQINKDQVDQLNADVPRGGMTGSQHAEAVVNYISRAPNRTDCFGREWTLASLVAALDGVRRNLEQVLDDRFRDSGVVEWIQRFIRATAPPYGIDTRRNKSCAANSC